MWAGQRVLCLLQNLFKQSKLSLMLTLAWGKFWGSCNWDPWAPHIALHASWNVPRHLRRLETVQAVEHSVVVNGCKNNGNSYYWSQVTTLLIRRSIAIHSLWHAVKVLPQAHAPNNPVLRYLFNPSFDKWIDKHEAPCYCHLKKLPTIIYCAPYQSFRWHRISYRKRKACSVHNHMACTNLLFLEV